ncbi:MAG: hypothetical protein A4E32_01379 [Methanomassiliicoccales archaeon PtaU1.Bin124]|nr:MAG: hypothetical protein A4E32_01379 [Methanomassiliicoccales archaeon PtaU1.Bin124]
MKSETEWKFRKELRSFFGLIMLNLVTAALVMGLSVAFAVNTLNERVQAGDILSLSLLLVPLGAIAMALGVYWIVKTAEMIEGITDIRESYKALPGDASEEQITSLMIKMTALYRANRPVVAKMIVLGTAGGALFILMGGVQLITQLAAVYTSGSVLLDNAFALLAAFMSIGVGTVGVLTAKYFSIYSKVWDARLTETEKIEEALKQKLEGD